jgi:hypothetical protein
MIYTKGSNVLLHYDGAEQPITIITYHEIFMCVEYRKLFLKS